MPFALIFQLSSELPASAGILATQDEAGCHHLAAVTAQPSSSQTPDFTLYQRKHSGSCLVGATFGRVVYINGRKQSGDPPSDAANETADELPVYEDRSTPPTERRTIACCRLNGGWLARRQEPLCRSLNTEIEVYRLDWSSSFDGDALIRIGREDDRISLQAMYRRGSFSSDQVERDIVLSIDDWNRLQDALIDASFWALDMRHDRVGFDGATWTMEGRRKEIYCSRSDGVPVARYGASAGCSSRCRIDARRDLATHEPRL